MRRFYIIFLIGLLVGISLFLIGNRLIASTSSDAYCMSCHMHEKADKDWQISTHYETKSGVRTSCVECHLPPKEMAAFPGVKKGNYLLAKGLTGMKDVWSYWTKDSSEIDWEGKRSLEYARGIVYESSCLACHETLFPPELSQEGEDAHLYYKMKKEEGMEDLHCINCHLNAGHHIEGYTHGANESFGKTASAPKDLFTAPMPVTSFTSFTEQIPNSAVSFRMVAIPGGTFRMGSEEGEALRRSDEGPVREVTVSPFFMAEVETTWDEYLAFYAQTSGEGRSSDTEGSRLEKQLDAISGATPPYGQPDQGWGMGQRPVVSISHHAAETYCRWLSQVTGKKYRLPTEAEWEYAARAGSQTPYFFEKEGDEASVRLKVGKMKIRVHVQMDSLMVYKKNSHSKTQEPSYVTANAFGLKNLIGNVAEFCADWYAPDTYARYPEGMLIDPKGPAEGKEHVVRGGTFRDEAANLRSAARSYTKTEQWLRTDPQMPKSIWWYSDCFHVGFRVVCDYEEQSIK